MNRVLAILMWAVVGVLSYAPVLPAAPEESGFLDRVKADTEWLTGYGTRQVGTPEHARLHADLLARLRAIPGVQVWTQEFPVVVPVNQESYLELSGDLLPGRHAIHPVWPDVARLNTTPAGGIRGKLIYVGEAGYEQIPARSLQGNIAVMELSGYADYRRVFDFGATAVIFLESAKAEGAAPSNQSLYKPRYFVPNGPLADALRAGRVPEGVIVSRGRWETVTARNIYAGLKPAVATQQRPYAVVAAYDSMSKVMGVAPGADMALDCALVLNLLRDEARAPRRPLLFGFLDAYHINQLGMRRMAAMTALTPRDRTRVTYAKLEQEDLDAYRAAADELARFKTAGEGLAMLHDRQACKELRIMFKDAVGPELLKLQKVQGDVRLVSLRREAENRPAVRVEMLGSLDRAVKWLQEEAAAELSSTDRAVVDQVGAFLQEERKRPAAVGKEGTWAKFSEARSLASSMLPVCTQRLLSRNRILDCTNRKEGKIETADVPLAQKLWERMALRVRGQLEEQQGRCGLFDPMDQLRGEIARALVPGCTNGVERAVCDMVVGFDLSDCGLLVGPGALCDYNRIDGFSREFNQAFKRAVKRDAIWPQGAASRRLVNMAAIEGGSKTGSGANGRALITSPAKSFRLPGVTWVTDDALRRFVDSPLDRFASLDWNRIAPQLLPSREFLAWLLATSEDLGFQDPAREAGAEWRHGMGRIVDVSAGQTVPRVPRAGFLTTLVAYGRDLDGIRRQEFSWTGHDGSFRIPLMCAEVDKMHKPFSLAAFKLNETGAITEALSVSESLVVTRLTTSFNLGVKPGEQLPRAVTFACKELNGPSFYDARFLEPLKTGTLVDAVRGGAPKKAFFSLDAGQMWGLVEPDIMWQLVLKAGAARVRMALLNAQLNGREQGLSLRETFLKGYGVGETLPAIPTLISAQDIHALDTWRLADYRAAGIRSQKIDEMHEITRASLEEAAAAVKRDDGAALQRSASRALGDEIRAYQAVTDMGLDVARGAIFLMLMLVPFCVAMERLIFACARIGRQIAASLAIFALMTALLWSFHPAFKISAQPLVIVMAFTILAMSVIVISMVLRRFKSSVQEFQSTMAEGSGANMGRGGLLGSAIFLGIANMRKRRVRTLLTGTTIVLVTFALLCFSSASSFVDRKDFRVEGGKSSEPSVLIRRPTMGPLSLGTLPAIQNLLGMKGVTIGERIWLTGEAGDVFWSISLLNPQTGKQVPVKGALGVSPIENRLSGIDRVLENWDEFATGGGCYVSKDTADELGVKRGDTLVVRGRDLVVRGVFDPLRLEDEVALLDGQKILPYDFSREVKDWIDHNTQSAVEQEMSSASSMQPSGDESDRYLPARQVIVVPASVLTELKGSLRSLGLACASTDRAAEAAKRLTQTIVYPAYYSNKEGGVNVVMTTPLVAVPPKNLAIPLIVAALIIFTTMLNSVSERKREIYVYTSLGLAPTHVGALFVAEALTYGLMGAVFGYIAGQGLAAFLTHFGWMQGVTLNYSGSAVIKTMLLVQGVVVLSAIVPSIVAGKIASPSKDMDWKVPQPVNGVIRDMLPFTINVAAAPGIVAFIHEYLEAHRDGVLGGFDVDETRLLPAGSDGAIAGVEARVWLAPYDMGVRQVMRFRVEPPEDGACSISAEIRHEGGAEKTWWRLNKPFFGDLRRQLLGWRKLSPERVREYVARTQKSEVAS
jgi:hypothetical protein